MTLVEDHVCSPTKNAGEPHLLKIGTRYECPCGKVWFVTRKDRKTRRGYICECGWAHYGDLEER